MTLDPWIDIATRLFITLIIEKLETRIHALLPDRQTHTHYLHIQIHEIKLKHIKLLQDIPNFIQEIRNMFQFAIKYEKHLFRVHFRFRFGAFLLRKSLKMNVTKMILRSFQPLRSCNFMKKSKI